MDISAIGVPTFFTRAEAWECDHNQHWNVRQYMRVFQQAGFVASDMSGHAPRYPFTQHTRYHRELVQTSAVEIRSATLSDGDFAGATVHLLCSNGQLSATGLEQPGHGHPLPTVSAEDVKLALPRGIEGAPLTADTSDVPASARRIEHGMVQPREADHTGSLAIDGLMGRMAAATNDLMARLGFTPDFVKESRISRMGVESKVTIFAPIPVGTRLHSGVRTASRGSKNMVLRHRFFATDGTQVAAADQSLVTVDMTTRRATDLPDFLKEATDGA